MPQPKKHSSVRARANKASTAAVLVDAALSAVDAPDDDESVEECPVIRPDLPRRDGGWHPQTLEWWEDLWAAPMAAEYHSSDRHALFLLAILIDDFWLEPSQKLAAEIRLQRQAFGLTPYDRRRLEWTIVTAEQAKERGGPHRAVGRSAPQPQAGDDPRLALVQ